MGDELRSGGVNQAPNTRDEIHQSLELKHVLPLNIFICTEYASTIQSSIVFGNSISPKTLKEFYRTFWHIYFYVKGSVDAEKLNPGLIEVIDKWFELMTGQSKNTKLVIIGIELYLDLVKNMQEWGIGRLFDVDIDPMFMYEKLDDFDLLIEELDEEVVGSVS
jgi:hypothetical protein